MSISCNVVFCEDIRQEVTGKHILIGVYTEHMLPGVIPQNATFSFWARLIGVPLGDYGVKVIVGANDVSQHVLHINLKVMEQEAGRANLFIVGVPIYIPDYGSIYLTIDGLPDGKAHTDKLMVKK